MIKRFLTFIFLILVAILQLTAVPIFTIKYIMPNLILAFAVVLLLLDFETLSFYMAGIGGLILDLVRTTQFALNTIILIAITYLLKIIIHKFISEINILIVFVVALTSEVLFEIISFLINRLPFSWNIVWGGLYTATFAVILFSLMNLYLLKKQNSQVKEK